MTALRLAFSPCPNDTFVFHALVHGLVPGAPPVTVTYADVDVTNTSAQTGAFDVVKVSYAALPWLLDAYELLPCGGAVGRGCGPLIVTAEDRPLASLAGARVAVPGDRTSAYLLFRLWAAEHASVRTAGGSAPSSITVLPFDAIMPAVRDGLVDAGLVIHEARFTYPRYGLRALVDLGTWWEESTGLPLPLGAILAHRERTTRVAGGAGSVADWIRASVRAAWADPAASRDYVLEHAQVKETTVVDRHIELYVNSFTEDLGEAGYAAVETLLGRAAEAGLVPPLATPLR